MRCKNCGWPNKPGVSVCVKCQEPLVAEDDDVRMPDPVNNNYQEPAPMPGAQLNKTVMESDIFGSQSSQYDSSSARNDGYQATRMDSEPERASSPSLCPKCGYPLRPGAEKCPNCQREINPAPVKERARRQEEPDEERRATRLNAGAKGFRGTVNPYMMNMQADPTFELKPIKRLNERHDPKAQEYEGEEVILNRDNTEPNNASITSREQAVVTNIDGKWYIQDKSDQKTTFVQASDRIELHDGDIILLGNRLFEFHS